MIRFYTVEELYKTEDISDVFLTSFNRLTQSAQEIVKSKNNVLREWLVEHSAVLDHKDDVVSLNVEVDSQKLTDKSQESGCVSEFHESALQSNAVIEATNCITENKEAENQIKDKESTDVVSNKVNDGLIEEKESVEYKEVIQDNTPRNEELDETNLIEKMNKEYNSLNFKQDIIRIKNLYLISLKKKAKDCPIHKKRLIKKKVLINGIKKEFMSCDLCKRFYSFNQEDEVKKLRKANIPYNIIEL